MLCCQVVVGDFRAQLLLLSVSLIYRASDRIGTSFANPHRGTHNNRVTKMNHRVELRIPFVMCDRVRALSPETPCCLEMTQIVIPIYDSSKQLLTVGWQ